MTDNGMREKEDDMQQMATGRTRTLGRCSEDRASVHGSLPTELVWCPDPPRALVDFSGVLMKTICHFFGWLISVGKNNLM